MNSKKQTLFLVLAGIFLTNAIIAEIIGAKIFSLEKTLSKLFDKSSFLTNWNVDYDFTAGTLIWPLVFVISDLINEYFGVKGVKLVSFFTVVLITFSSIIIYLSIWVEPSNYWLEVNSIDSKGNSININEGFRLIFNQGIGIIFGSLVAFLLAQIIDALTFEKIKIITKNKHLWLRATGSTVISQLFDSYIIIFIAFYIFGDWEISEVLKVSTNNYVFKLLFSIVLTPLIYFGHYIIDRYLKSNLPNR